MPWHAAATFRRRSNGSGIGIWQEWAGVHCESLPPLPAAAHDGKATRCWITYLQQPAGGENEQKVKTNRMTSTPVLLLAAMNFRNHLPIPQWAVKEGMNQKTSPPALVLAAIGFWHHLPVLERAVMADTSKESTETSPPALPLAATSLMEVGFGEARCQQQPTRLGSANAADSDLCPICHLRLKLRQNDRREKVLKHHQMTNAKCLQKQWHDRRQACPNCGKKIAGPRQRYTWDVAQPWSINEPTPTPMERNGRHFPTPYNAAGLLWTGKKSGEEVEKRAVRSRLRLVDMTDTNTDNS